MRIPPAYLALIRDGACDLQFRRWDRPRVLAGTQLRTKVGLLEVLDVAEVDAASLTEDDARRAGSGFDELLAFVDRRAELPLFRVELRFAGDDPRVALREDAALDDAARAELHSRLARLDRASRRGPWTGLTLNLIRRRPAVRAPDLAASLGLETQVFKRDVRKLKELGLTESLEVGYRISPRGRALMDRAALVVVDVQTGFDDPAWGPRNNPDCEANVAALLAHWRAAGQPVVFVRHDSLEEGSPLAPGNPFKPELTGEPDLLVTKSVNSSFHGTPSLAEWLDAQAISTIYVCGITTNHCCETTARVGGNLGYEVFFVLDATHTFDRGGFTADELAAVTAANLEGEFATVVTTAAVQERAPSPFLQS